MGKGNPFDDLDDLLQKFKRDATNPHETSIPPAKAVKALQVAYALLNEQRNLQPGDIIVGVPELTASHIRGWDRPHIIAEILPEPIRLTVNPETVGSNNAAKSYGAVIIGLFHDEGKDIALRFYADLREWQLHPDAAKLKAAARES